MIFYILGNKGTGKTTLITLFAHIWHDLSSNIKYYMTYDLYKLPFIKIESIEQLDKITHKPIFLGLDEGWINADARRSMSLNNLILGRYSTQARKKWCDMFISAQDYDFLDKRVKAVIDYIIQPSIITRFKDEVEGLPLILDLDIFDENYDYLTTKRVSLIYDNVIIPFAFNTDEEIKPMVNIELVKRKELIKKYYNYEKLLKIDHELSRKELSEVIGGMEEELNPTQCNRIAGTILTHRKYKYKADFFDKLPNY